MWLAPACAVPEGSEAGVDSIVKLHAQMRILLRNILESVLVREFQKSCNFSCGDSDGTDINTAQGYNTPFRGDHPESLIVT